jgi:hypothetical protein
MNSPQRDLPAQGRDWTRRLVNVLVTLVVIAVAGATFVFSYAGVHAVALLGGVSAQLARYYPGLFDAVLVIACLAAVMLRDAPWWARAWAWLVLVVLLAAIGTADVLHAADYTLRHRTTEGIVAAAPVVAVLLAFSLLLTMLRQSRAQAPVAPAAPVASAADVPALPAAVAAAPIALPAAPVATAESPTVAAEPPTVAAPAVPAAPAEPQDALPVGEPTVPVPVSAPTITPPPPPRPAAVPVPEAPVPEAAVPAAPVPAAPVPAAPVPAAAVPEAEPPQPVPPIGQTPGTPEPFRDAPPADETAREGDAPQDAHPLTMPDEVVRATAPAGNAGEETGEPAPPTVEVPAVTQKPLGIRYASDSARAKPKPADYWEAQDTQQLAGVVYRAQDDEDEDEAPHAPAVRAHQPELDDDAPPFATAPFAPVPRLNRVRSMPVRPEDEDE